MINARIQLEPDTNRIINMFKAKYDLKDKSEAINHIIRTYGKSECYPEVEDDYIYKMKAGTAQYLHSNPGLKKSMNKKKLDKLFKK